MKFSFSWLKRYLDTDFSCTKIADILTSIGFEVESLSGDFQNDLFVIVDVRSVVAHPGADKLSLCEVFDGSETFKIVCGAKNVKVGMKAVLAKVGARIPKGDFVIKTAKIRGEKSCGMLCSVDELGLEEASEGILEISDDMAVGQNFFEYDPVFDISVLPNRGDCLGVYGIARELSVAGVGTLKSINLLKIPETSSDFFYDISVEEGTCSIMLGKISGINNSCKTPDWLKSCLKAAGVSLISPVVDISNYVMLTTSSPIHIYDANKISGNKVNISFLKKSKSFTPFDGSDIELSEGDITIEDASGEVLCLAGIIGGISSGCSESTSDVLVECGAFDADSIVKTVRSSGISTEASYRFERYVDPAGLETVFRKVCSLICVICGGYMSSVYKNVPEISDKRIEFSHKKCCEFCNADLNVEDVIRILDSLGFSVESKSDDLYDVYVPSRRKDINDFEDLAEEVIRFIGYDAVQEVPFNVCFERKFDIKDKIRKLAVICGMDEVITWSFANSELSSSFGETSKYLYLSNPPSEELDMMRNSLAPNMINLLRESFSRGKESLSIFEIGKIYRYSNSYEEHYVVAGLRSGVTGRNDFYKESRQFDFFDVKGDVINILNAMGMYDISFISSSLDQYSRWESADCFYKDKKVAHFGLIKPNIIPDINSKVFYFEIQICEALGSDLDAKKYIASKFQSSERDFSFLFASETKIGDVIESISKSDNIINSVYIKDIYSDEKVFGKDIISVLISVSMSSNERTLKGEEIALVCDQIIKKVTNIYGGKIRAV